MSRIYDALQHSSCGRIEPDPSERRGDGAVLSEPFRDSEWDPTSASQVQPQLTGREKLPALFAKHSIASEQFRLLATRMEQLQQSRRLKSILLTSALAGEGKSTLIVNLAVSLAQGGQNKVLVVDADLRKPGLSLICEVDSRAGLREWYQTDRPVSEFTYRIADTNVWVLPAGQTLIDPLELLKSSRITDVLTSLSAAFDWVLIDSPPLLPLADAEVISRISDGTMIVVRRGKSVKSALTQALERVAPAKMTGLLLNDFPLAAAYGYPESVHDSHPDSTRSRRNVYGFWNRTANASLRALRFCSTQFGRLARRGA